MIGSHSITCDSEGTGTISLCPPLKPGTNTIQAMQMAYPFPFYDYSQQYYSPFYASPALYNQYVHPPALQPLHGQAYQLHQQHCLPYLYPATTANAAANLTSIDAQDQHQQLDKETLPFFPSSDCSVSSSSLPCTSGSQTRSFYPLAVPLPLQAAVDASSSLYGYHYQCYGPGPSIATSNVATGPPGSNLFLFYISNETTNWDLYELFIPFGSILSVHIMLNRETGLGKGYGFLSFDNRASAAAATRALNGLELHGKKLKVQFKKDQHHTVFLSDSAVLELFPPNCYSRNYLHNYHYNSSQHQEQRQEYMQRQSHFSDTGFHRQRTPTCPQRRLQRNQISSTPDSAAYQKRHQAQLQPITSNQSSDSSCSSSTLSTQCFPYIEESSYFYSGPCLTPLHNTVTSRGPVENGLEDNEVREGEGKRRSLSTFSRTCSKIHNNNNNKYQRKLRRELQRDKTGYISSNARNLKPTNGEGYMNISSGECGDDDDVNHNGELSHLEGCCSDNDRSSSIPSALTVVSECEPAVSVMCEKETLRAAGVSVDM